MAGHFEITRNMREKICENCHLVVETYKGSTPYDGDDPAEYSCPCDLEPEYVVESGVLMCGVREAE
jgi:hypothetical protein